jgi:guanylate kinase
MPSTSFFSNVMNSSAGVRIRRLSRMARYNGHLYGTPRSFIDESLRASLDVIMKPEVNGALAIKERYPGAVLIFLLPDNFCNLRRRLEARRTEPTSRSPRV